MVHAMEQWWLVVTHRTVPFERAPAGRANRSVAPEGRELSRKAMRTGKRKGCAQTRDAECAIQDRAGAEYRSTRREGS